MRPTAQIAILYVPCGNDEEAVVIARTLVEERLVACANFWHSRSIYRWNDSIQDGPETIMLLKTTASGEARARARIRELHSYEIPCILSIGITDVNPDYSSWVRGEVGRAGVQREAES
jgi:periplasmic divalent cation tolerance protein